MTKSTKMWSLIDIYYKHGQGSLHSFVTEHELYNFLMEQLNYYSKYLKIGECDDISTDSLIYYIIDLGQKMITEQYGSGIIEVHMLDFETQTITVYN